MQQSASTAFILADECIGYIEDDAVTQQWQRADFRDGDGKAVRINLETAGIVHATEREAVKLAADTDFLLVEQRRDIDDFGDLLTDDFGDKGFPAGMKLG